MHISTPINHINKYTIKIHYECTYTIIIIRKFLLFFFTKYMNE